MRIVPRQAFVLVDADEEPLGRINIRSEMIEVAEGWPNYTNYGQFSSTTDLSESLLHVRMVDNIL